MQMRIKEFLVVRAEFSASSKLKAFPLVAAPAVLKVRIAERPTIVMARGTAPNTRLRQMHRRLR